MTLKTLAQSFDSSIFQDSLFTIKLCYLSGETGNCASCYCQMSRQAVFWLTKRADLLHSSHVEVLGVHLRNFHAFTSKNGPFSADAPILSASSPLYKCTQSTLWPSDTSANCSRMRILKDNSFRGDRKQLRSQRLNTIHLRNGNIGNENVESMSGCSRMGTGIVSSRSEEREEQERVQRERGA
ncbi:hypothetical protein K438DRAFT_1946905 [Mycena galopus ATCC 62051]|nr:hypothetical protein K438DRAFT_1946905 [Mycena galopus ATCC 62051]